MQSHARHMAVAKYTAHLLVQQVTFERCVHIAIGDPVMQCMVPTAIKSTLINLVGEALRVLLV